MGYTHAWRLKRAPSDEAWALVVADVKRLIALPDVEPMRLIGRQRPFLARPQVDEERILLNGRYETGGEALHVDRADLHCRFCKTGWRPYDPAVVAVLALLHHHLGSEGFAAQLGDNLALRDRARDLLRQVREGVDLPENEDPMGEDFEHVEGQS